MPLKDLVLGMDEVPRRVKTIAAGLVYRDFVTVGLLVSSLKLQNETKRNTFNHIVPDCWIYVQDRRVKLGRVQIFNNWSPYLVKDVEHTVFLGLEYFCDEGDSLWNLDELKLRDFAVRELIRIGMLSDREKVLDYHIEKVKKAYPAYFDTYRQRGVIIDYLNRFDNLYCVGRGGQHRYNNMDHSMMTSFEAVKNIVSGKKSKENIWNINTEGKYHES
jgi:protoporphyrinogen oxidase